MALARVDVSWSTVIDAPIEAVWKTVRQFSAKENWLGIPMSVEGGGADNQVGQTVRIIPLGDKVLRERLVTLSDEAHSFEYRILMDNDDDKAKNPFPGTLHDYVGSFQLHEIKDGNRTYGVWSVRFETEVEKTELMKGVINGGVTEGGLTKLRDHFAKK